MSERGFSFNITAFNKEVGHILYDARMSACISPQEVSNKVDYFSAHSLQEVEAGETSLPCNVLSKLFELYQMNQEQMRIFCFPEETRKRFTNRARS